MEDIFCCLFWLFWQFVLLWTSSKINSLDMSRIDHFLLNIFLSLCVFFKHMVSMWDNMASPDQLHTSENFHWFKRLKSKHIWAGNNLQKGSPLCLCVSRRRDKQQTSLCPKPALRNTNPRKAAAAEHQHFLHKVLTQMLLHLYKNNIRQVLYPLWKARRVFNLPLHIHASLHLHSRISVWKEEGLCNHPADYTYSWWKLGTARWCLTNCSAAGHNEGSWGRQMLPPHSSRSTAQRKEIELHRVEFQLISWKKKNRGLRKIVLYNC